METKETKEVVETTQDNGNQKSELTKLAQDELVDIIRQTRTEAKNYRLELKSLKEKQQEFDTQKRKEEEDKLKAEGEYQKLLAERERELEAIKPKADAFEKLRLAEIDETKTELTKLDKWDEEYSNLSIPALRKLRSSLLKTNGKPEDVDDGKPADPPKVTLTAEQRKEAYEKFPYQTKEQAEQSWFEVLRKTGKIK